MRTSLIICAVLVLLAGTASVAAANPAMLPHHPGYPMDNAVDPITGQSLANDPGQTNATGEKWLFEAASIDDPHVMQNMGINQNNLRVLEKPGAGLLPKVDGPNIKIEPPVKEGTKMNASPQ